MKHHWARLKGESKHFVQFGAVQSKNSSMVKAKICWIKSNWTSRSLQYTCTSLLEEDWSIARPGTREVTRLLFKRFQIDLLISHFCYVIVIDLSLVITMSFEPRIFMHKWVSYMWLKSWWWFSFPSICTCLLVSWWNIYVLWMYHDGPTRW